MKKSYLSFQKFRILFISALPPAQLLFLLIAYYLAFSADLRASDVRARLNSADGSTSFQVKDSADIMVGQIDSDGHATFQGSVTVRGAGGITIGTGNNRSITDEPGNNRLNISTALVLGNLQLQGLLYPGEYNASQGSYFIMYRSTSGRVETSTTAYVTGDVIAGNDVIANRYLRPGVLVASAAYISAEVTTTAQAATDIPGMSANFTINSVPAVIFANFSGEGRRTDGTNDWHDFSFSITDGNNTTYAQTRAWLTIGHNHNDGCRVPIGLTTGIRVTTTGDYTVKARYWAAYGTIGVGNRSFTAYVIPTP